MPPNPAGKQPQSMSEGLQKVLGDIAQLMAAPDADMQFLSALQQAIVMQIRNSPGLQDPQQQQQMAMMQQQMGGAGGAGPGGPGGLPAGAGAAGPPGGPGPMGGGMPGLTPTAPNMDEIRRMLQAQGTAQ